MRKGNGEKRKDGLWTDAAKRFRKNKLAMAGLVMLAILILCALFANYIAPFHYDEQNLPAAFESPSLRHLMGTDNLGRDIFSRIIYGTRTSLSIALVAVLVATLAGGLMGAVAAFYGGVLDNVIMRFLDVFLAIPSTLLAIAIAAVLGPGVTNTVLAITIGQLPGLARIVRATVLSIKGEEYIRAARSIGAGNMRIIGLHILPNAMAPIIVQATLYVASAILSISSLSFIGLGIQPPTPEWGSMLSAGRAYIRDYWFIVAFPGLAIMATIFAFNLIGDGLRDALDPRLKN